ncbi:hypothetical protein QBC47DRAFT_166326 [Echria macrotheca]|uniref:Uncharacterized protein n=1 Tax=Echria macrotheca TaxID=438768 RepID=A0AAJ0BH92_9PEZI|nr:hypothetical protein QBC47DRAFT_166326 [Echria macrotheca]
MPRLPPAEKLSLAVRKNFRDEYDANKADLEKQLSEVLGTAWTVEVNPNAIWPYHNDGYAKDSLGSCIKGYIDGAIYQLKYLTGRYENLAQEVNDLASAHVITIDVEETSPPRFSYCGCDVQDGKLRILFTEKCLGTNIDYAMAEEPLFNALNAAPATKPLSFRARIGIRADYEPAIGAVQHQIAELLGKDDSAVTLNPNFEEVFAKLAEGRKAKNSDVRDDFEQNLGSFSLKYFEALAYQMKYIKVGEDEMIQEGFLEAVPSLEFVLRVVDALKNDSYCECVIEGDKLYLQCKPGTWGSNIDYVASKVMDLL